MKVGKPVQRIEESNIHFPEKPPGQGGQAEKTGALRPGDIPAQKKTREFSYQWRRTLKKPQWYYITKQGAGNPKLLD